MTDYRAPLDDMRFILHHQLGLARLNVLPPHAELDADLVDAVLEQAAKVAEGVLDPLNGPGDKAGAKWKEGAVTMPAGFKDAYRQHVEGGWNAVPFPAEHGGQGLPWVLAFCVSEMWQSANMAFALCPLLNQGAVEAILSHGSAELQATYLPKLIEGSWTGTMNLTEPQAGSDLSQIRAKAVPEGDHFRITGTKIFITYGEHDLSDNIVHLVLARLPDAPPGVKGISLFIVPKLIPDANGNPGAHNDLRCVSIEHKLGIHASPTCVMSFGDEGGATGWLIGEANRGLEYMFTMMNNARLGVGLQGVAVGERARQRALGYAKTRVQGKSITGTAPAGAPIIIHPDIRRMLLSMRVLSEAGRALALRCGLHLDESHHHPDEAERRRAQAFVDFLTPIVKAWCTDNGVAIASEAVQVHGGMGFIEETGAAQHLRDARIAPIYEGTNGIQANDLAFRKILRDKGATARLFLAEVKALDAELTGHDDLVAIRQHLSDAASTLSRALDWLLDTGARDAGQAAGGAVNLLALCGLVAGGAELARGAVIAAGLPQTAFTKAKLTSARYFAEQHLSRARGLLTAVTTGWDRVAALSDDEI